MHTFPTPHPAAIRGAMLSILLIACLSGCAPIGSDYHRSPVDAPAGWQEPQTNFSTAQWADLQTWWRSFNDPILDQLIAQALVNNQDLRIALARLQQARAERVQIAAGLGPTVSIGSAGDSSRASNRLDTVAGGHSQTWHAGFDASWELDMFGGIRRAVESADANIEALTNDRQALLVSLLAELASRYAELRTAQARLAIAHDNIRNLRESETLAARALQRGLGTAAQMMQARAEREAAQAQPPQLEADIARLSHAIGVLAGGLPGDWRAALASPSPVLPVAPALPLVLPSQVIRQRPDLKADERRLAAATAQIGQADAARFPRFSIPLGIGASASLIHNLFSTASLAWSAAMQASQTLYDGGSAQAGVTAARARADMARLAYQRDVGLALRDVEDSLITVNSERQRQVSLRAAVDDSHKALDRSTRLYRAGLSAYLPVLISQRAANQARDALALSQWAEVNGAISLYKALGAGWQKDSPRRALQSPSGRVQESTVVSAD